MHFNVFLRCWNSRESYSYPLPQHFFYAAITGSLASGLGLERTGSPQDIVCLWMQPNRAPDALQLGRPVEPILWSDKVI